MNRIAKTLFLHMWCMHMVMSPGQTSIQSLLKLIWKQSFLNWVESISKQEKHYMPPMILQSRITAAMRAPQSISKNRLTRAPAPQHWSNLHSDYCFFSCLKHICDKPCLEIERKIYADAFDCAVEHDCESTSKWDSLWICRIRSVFTCQDLVCVCTTCRLKIPSHSSQFHLVSFWSTDENTIFETHTLVTHSYPVKMNSCSVMTKRHKSVIHDP